MKITSIKLACLSVVTALAFLGITGCQTSDGFGRDVEKLGENIQKSAN